MNILSGHRLRWPRRSRPLTDIERLPYQMMAGQILTALEEGLHTPGTEFIAIAHILYFCYLIDCPWLINNNSP